MADNNQLVVSASEQARFLPVMSVATGIERYRNIQEVISKLMVEGVDYGIIPGAGDKPSLWKPGAEKLNNMFGLTPRYELTATEDWTGEKHDGEPFFYYRVKCSLFRGDYLIGEGEGSSNSWESKYRWRTAERVCPQCGKAAIIKGREDFGGGWVCYGKKGGCGAKFPTNEERITSQPTGKVFNPEIYDQVNVLLKMADKRALIAATLNATGASQFFSQDLEDLPSSTPDAGAKSEPAKSTDFAMLRAFAEMKAQIGEQAYYGFLRAHRRAHSNELTDKAEASGIYMEMESYRRASVARPASAPAAPAPPSAEQPTPPAAAPDEWAEWDRIHRGERS